MLVIKCQEELDELRKWAKEKQIEPQLDKVLKYLEEYGEGSVLTELYPDNYPQCLSFVMYRLSPCHRDKVMWMCGGVIYDDTKKSWSCHT